MRQSTSDILMVRPDFFLYNEETALSNAFQKQTDINTPEELQHKVLEEFDGMVRKLKSRGINVNVFNDTPDPPTPDAVFPNNWVMFHHSGNVSLFPMEARNRRGERRADIIESLRDSFVIGNIHDYSNYEKEEKYLEGTGSMVFDHINKIAYACVSPRTHRELFLKYCREHNYQPQIFHAIDEGGWAIYHTNVMMCIGSDLAVICLDSIPRPEERSAVESSLKNTGHEIIDISFEQMNRFAGNMIELRSAEGGELLLMSRQAHNALTKDQIKRISEHVEIVDVPIYTIEQVGGGSARCMVAEIFAPIPE